MGTESLNNLQTYRNHRIVLWGAGIYGKKILEKCTALSISVVCFCDNNAALWGTEYGGLPVISPEDLKKMNENTHESPEEQGVLVQIALYPAHERYDEITGIIRNQLNELGIQRIYTTDDAMETVFFMVVMNELNETSKNLESIIKQYNPSDEVMKRYFFLEQEYKKLVPQKPMYSFVLNIIDHCNLNCQRCDHFSPLADTKFVTVDCVEKDMKQMSFLLNQSLEKLFIEGGEALLHPDLPEILSVCRKYFPETKIFLMTNGVLLLKQNQSFWDSCRGQQVVISVTKYPVNFDYDKAKEQAEKNQVSYEYYDGEFTTKTSFKLCLDEEKGQDPMRSFLHCHRANQCIYLMEGKFYLCPTVSNVKYLNQRFGTDFKVVEKDYIEIHQAKSKEDLTEFVAKPSPFCSYCMTAMKFEQIPWAVSKKLSTEWLPEKS